MRIAIVVNGAWAASALTAKNCKDALSDFLKCGGVPLSQWAHTNVRAVILNDAVKEWN